MMASDQDNDIGAALCGLREIIDMRGDDQYGDEYLHPGAVLVTFNGLTSSVAVIDPDGDGHLDIDEAEDVAVRYMRKRGLISKDQESSYVFRLEEVDTPAFLDDDTFAEVNEAISDYLDSHANENAAEAACHLGDAAAEDIQEAGFDPESTVVIAEFGDGIAVDGDLLVGPHWVKVLDLGIAPQNTWSNATKNGVEAAAPAVDMLRDWLEQHGYELTDFGGDQMPEEAEIEASSVIEFVPESTKFTEEQVEQVLAQEFEVEPGQNMYRTSDSGSVEVWSVPSEIVCLIEFTKTDSDDWSEVWYAIATATTEEQATELFRDAVESGEEGIWSADAVESGDTPERTEPRSTPLLSQSWYVTWYSDEELEESEDEDSAPEPSTELISPRSVKCFGSREELDEYLEDQSIGEAKIVWDEQAERD